MSSLDNSTSPLGINLTGVIDWSSELVFINYTKRMREWVSQKVGEPWGQGGPLNLDKHGWIRSLEEGQTAEMFIGTAPYYEAGIYHVFYRGEGVLRSFNGKNLLNKDTFTVESVKEDSYLYLTIVETNPENPIRDIDIIHNDQLKNYYNGEIFYSTFLENWKYYKTLRFMDWGQTNNNSETTWDSRTHKKNNSYSLSVPIEYRVELSNQLHANPWFCIPHQVDDHYIRQFARYVRDNLDKNLKIYLEHSNEVWNPIFHQFSYARERGEELGINIYDDGLSNDFYGTLCYHAHRTAEILQIWSEEFGSDSDRLIGVYAVGGPSRWMLEEGMNYLKSIDMDHHIDAVGIAPYIGAEHPYNTQEEAINILYKNLDNQDEHSLVKTVIEMREAADMFNLKLIAYEGGQHLWVFGQPFSKVGEAVQGNPKMYDWVKKYMNLWREYGGEEFMVFASGGGFWGQIPWGVKPLEAPKYRAHYDYISDNPIWFK